MTACNNAYRKKGDRKIYCRKIENIDPPLCGHIYFCSQKDRYELSSMAGTCRLRKEK